MSVRKSHSHWFVNMDELDKIHLERSAEHAAIAYEDGFAVYSAHIERTFPDFFSQVSTVISDEGWELVSTTSAGEHSVFVVFNRKPENRRVDDFGPEEAPEITPVSLNERGW